MPCSRFLIVGLALLGGCQSPEPAREPIQKELAETHALIEATKKNIEATKAAELQNQTSPKNSN